MTTAEVRSPSAAPAPLGRWPQRASAGARLIMLHLRSRRVPAGVLSMAACALVLRAALRWNWMFTSGSLAQQLPMIIEAGAVVVVVVTTHSPFGETERTTGRWLPYLRLGAALALTGLAIGVLQLGVTGASLNGGVLELARNVVGLSGVGLLCAPVTGGLLAWTLPVGYVAFAEYALLESWVSPWVWPVRPPADRGAWICAGVVYAVGLLAFTVRGARTRLADSG
jgi:hypothetical protein